MKIIKKLFSVFFATFFVFFANLSVSFAQIIIPNKVGPEGSKSLTEWIVDMLQILIGLAGLVAVAVLIVNAFSYITASGDEAKVQKATKGITYAIIGLIIAAISFLIINFVIDNLNADVQTDGGGASVMVLVV